MIVVLEMAISAPHAFPTMKPNQIISPHWITEPDVVIAVSLRSRRSTPIPYLKWPITSLLTRLGMCLPNPTTARVSFELLVRTADILMERATALTVAMAGREVLVEAQLVEIGAREFGRTLFFCSENCRDLFLRNPERYAAILG